MLEVTSPETFQQSRVITAGGGGMPTSLIAGCFTFASPESEWLVKYLPPIIHLSASDAHSPPWFQSTLQFIATETVQDLPGSAVIVDRLAEVLFVQACGAASTRRIRMGTRAGSAAWPTRRSAAALRLMHAEPGRAWTVPELARQVSMSRSAFAARFRALVGRHAARSSHAMAHGPCCEPDARASPLHAGRDCLRRRVRVRELVREGVSAGPRRIAGAVPPEPPARHEVDGRNEALFAQPLETDR